MYVIRNKYKTFETNSNYTLSGKTSGSRKYNLYVSINKKFSKRFQTPFVIILNCLIYLLLNSERIRRNKTGMKNLKPKIDLSNNITYIRVHNILAEIITVLTIQNFKVRTNKPKLRKT